MSVYQQLFAAVGAYVTSFEADLTKHDRAALAERPGVAFLHYARPMGTTLVWLPPIDADDYPSYGNRVKYLFGTADRDHILQQKIDLAKYHTHPSNYPEQFIAHHYDGQRLRPVTVGDAVTIAERYASAIRRVWNAERLAGLPCRSANGRYLDGWYSVPNPRPIDRESLKPPRSSDRS